MLAAISPFFLKLVDRVAMPSRMNFLQQDHQAVFHQVDVHFAGTDRFVLELVRDLVFESKLLAKRLKAFDNFFGKVGVGGKSKFQRLVFCQVRQAGGTAPGCKRRSWLWHVQTNPAGSWAER